MTYEYVCQACGHQWEAEQSIKDRPLETCVSCGAARAKRLVSGGTGFLLKGGGWYADLYGSPGSAASKAGTDDKAKAGSAKKPESSGDAKPSGDGKSSSEKSSGEKAASSTSSGSGSASTSPSAPASAKAS